MNHRRSVQLRLARSRSCGAFVLFALAFLSIFTTPAFAQYKRVDLVSNQAGVAPTQDAHLVNGWGLVALPASPFWVSDNGTGFSTLYTGAGQQIPLFVTIPPAPTSPAGSLGTPTGVVGNISPNPKDFTFTNKENDKSGAAVFIFATLDGTISAWNPTVDGGFVDVFDTGGTLIKHFAVHGPLHSPWGIAQAPSDFGPMSNAILISNNISRGRINAFNPQTGQFLGPLRDASGKPIEIDGVWALQFGQGGGPNGAPNQLFFTAGPNNYANGLFGVITFGQ